MELQILCLKPYYVGFLSEVIPEPKMYMPFALLNCVGKTSGFVGPLIPPPIISWPGTYAYWSLFGMGFLEICILFRMSIQIKLK